MHDHHVKVVILGSPAAGKSTFIAGLGVLGGADRDSGIQVHARENKNSRGLDYLKRLKTFLNNQEWPPPSHTTEIVDLAVFYNSKIIDLTFVDYPGKDFLEELSKMDPEKNLELFNAYHNADFLLVLLDPKIDLNIGNGDSVALRNQALERQEAVLQVIREKMFPKSNESSLNAGWNILKDKLKERIPPNIGILITKKDQMPQIKSSSDAKNLLMSEAPQFYKNLSDIGSKLKVFAVSAVGNTESVQVDGKTVLKPGKVLNPDGYEEIFDWIINVKWCIKTLKYAVYAGLMAVLLLLLIIYQSSQAKFAQNISVDNNLSSINKIDQISKIWFIWPWSSQVYIDPLLDKHVIDIERRIEELPGDSDLLVSIIKECETSIKNFPRVSLKVEDMVNKIREKREYTLFEKLKLSQKDSDFQKKANDFQKEFCPSGRFCSEVEKMKIEIGDEEYQKDKVYIQNFQVTNSNSLIEKSIKLKEVASKWKNKFSPEQMVQVNRAIIVAEGLANAGTTSSFTIDIEKTRNLNKAFYHYLQIYTKDNGSKDYKLIFESPKSSANVTEWRWDDKDLKIDWTFGTQIKILLRENGWIYNRDAGEQWFSDSCAILSLIGSVNLKSLNDYDLGKAQVVFKLKLNGQPLQESDREAFLVYFVRNSW